MEATSNRKLHCFERVIKKKKKKGAHNTIEPIVLGLLSGLLSLQQKE